MATTSQRAEQIEAELARLRQERQQSSRECHSATTDDQREYWREKSRVCEQTISARERELRELRAESRALAYVATAFVLVLLVYLNLDDLHRWIMSLPTS